MEAIKGGFGGNGVEPLAMVIGITVRMIMIMAGSGADEGEENTNGDGG